MNTLLASSRVVAWSYCFVVTAFSAVRISSSFLIYLFSSMVRRWSRSCIWLMHSICAFISIYCRIVWNAKNQRVSLLHLAASGVFLKSKGAGIKNESFQMPWYNLLRAFLVLLNIVLQCQSKAIRVRAEKDTRKLTRVEKVIVAGICCEGNSIWLVFS